MKKIYALFAAVLMTVSLSAATVYCKMTQEWWTKDGAAVGIYYWGSASSNPAWPGIRMNPEGNGIWSYAVPADVSVVIFTRVNGLQDGWVSRSLTSEPTVSSSLPAHGSVRTMR